jgi:hypothetical protein
MGAGAIAVNVNVSGLAALVVAVGFVVVFAAPVWVAARLVGAEHPTLLRSAVALIVGAAGAVAGIALGGGWALLLAPLSFLLAFRSVLGTSIPGAIALGFLAVLGYAAMAHFFGGGVTLTDTGTVAT